MSRPAHTPRYLLRRRIILEMLKAYPPQEFLEIGCGRGELLPWLHERGYSGIGLEISDAVRPIAEEAVAGFPSLRIIGDPSELAGRRFPYVMAFEVLEHIENDLELLRQWVTWLEPRGRFIFSVPARAKYWSASDEAVGHFRRYERETLEKLLDEAGLEVELWWSYGYPLVLATKPIRDFLHRRAERGYADLTKEQRTLDSSLDSTIDFGRGGRAAAVIITAVAFVAHWMSKPFRSTDLGDGYLVACTLKRGDA